MRVLVSWTIVLVSMICGLLMVQRMLPFEVIYCSFPTEDRSIETTEVFSSVTKVCHISGEVCKIMEHFDDDCPPECPQWAGEKTYIDVYRLRLSLNHCDTDVHNLEGRESSWFYPFPMSKSLDIVRIQNETIHDGTHTIIIKDGIAKFFYYYY